MAEKATTTTALATSLPPELLSRIFAQHIQFCKAEWDQGASKERLPASCWPEVGPYTWIRVTHVCRYWRDVALASPLLWSDIVLTCDQECLETMLTRSQQVALSVQSYTSSCSGEACPAPIRSLRLVLMHLFRIRSLALYIKWWVYLDIIDALRGPAPLLQRLTLSTPSGLYDTAYMQPVVHPPQHAPLEELTLCSFGFPWAHPVPFRALKSLRIVKGIPYRPEVDDVLDGLRLMPDLRSLALEDVFYPSASGLASLPAARSVVPLPKLQQLVLSGDCIACGTLLSSLELPSSTRITVNYHHTKRPEDLALALAAVKAKFTPEGKGAQERVEIEVTELRCRLEQYPTAYGWYFWQSPSDSRAEAASPFSTANLAVRIPHHPAHREVLLRELPVKMINQVAIAA